MKLWIVGGFLGAGKTSLLSALAVHLRSLEYSPLILENEAGQASLDDAYLADQGVEVKSILGGCACCDLRSRFVEQLDQVASQGSHDLVLFEPSGVASLQDLLHTVNLYGPDKVQVYMVLVIDINRLPTMIKALPGLLQSHLDLAQAMVISKADLVDSGELRTRTDWIVKRAMGIPYTTCNLLTGEGSQAADFLSSVLEGAQGKDLLRPQAKEVEVTYRFWSFELRFPSEGLAPDLLRQAVKGVIDQILPEGGDTVGHVKFLGSSPKGGSVLISGTGSGDLAQRGGGQNPVSGRGWMSVILHGTRNQYSQAGIQALIQSHLPKVDLLSMNMTGAS
jgi:Ni2+-binding GTPase involved in maturation of urease and hydrogenase